VQFYVPLIVATVLSVPVCVFAELPLKNNVSSEKGIESIRIDEIRKHTETLADDAFEGREAGEQGGYAAATYIIKALEKLEIQRAGTDGTYFQPFGSYRNILAVVPSNDPELAKQHIIVSAHYDHVGYGTKRSSKGTIGRIHNGADDNASGVAAILELAEAIQLHHAEARRTILFVFWDAEEKGLLGSKHWLNNPTIDLQSVRLMINVDMVGRLRKELELYGTRTMPGLRAAWSRANAANKLTLRFPWDVVNNSDHYEFFVRQIPITMMHTGLHEDYHRASDDVELLNLQGIEDTTELMLRFLMEIANRGELPAFRSQSMIEGKREEAYYQRPFRNQQRRLGLTVRAREASSGLHIESVIVGSPANEAGIMPGQVVLEANSIKLLAPHDLREQIFSADKTLVLKLETKDGEKSLGVKLAGKRQRVGLAWRTNDAEPGVIMVSSIRSGSPAEKSGLQLHDRICAVDGTADLNGDTFRELMNGDKDVLELTVERNGKTVSKTLKLGTNKTASSSGETSDLE